MTLPRFAFEEEEDDATGPAQFVLKLPPSYVQKLERLNARPTFPTTPSVPWTIETTEAPPAPGRWKLAAVFASVAVLVMVSVGIGSAAAQPSASAVGISKRAPKSLETRVRASARQTGVVTVAVDSLQRSRSHVRHRR